MKHPVYIN